MYIQLVWNILNWKSTFTPFVNNILMAKGSCFCLNFSLVKHVIHIYFEGPD